MPPTPSLSYCSHSRRSDSLTAARVRCSMAYHSRHVSASGARRTMRFPLQDVGGNMDEGGRMRGEVQMLGQG